MIIYYGWIDARKNQYNELLRLGVKGNITYNRNHECFENCECTEKVVCRLIKKFEGFWPGCFTGFENEEQLKKQKFWVMDRRTHLGILERFIQKFKRHKVKPQKIKIIKNVGKLRIDLLR